MDIPYSRQTFQAQISSPAIVALFIAVPALILRPFQNMPYVDDWVYAWSVERFLQNGALEVLEISTNPNLVQILWGAVFCLPAGFSFSALKMSTAVLSVFCLVGLYKLLRETGAGHRDAVLGTACLAFYPPYFILSFTFMTDVPFLAFWTWSLFALTKAIREKKERWLLAAAGFASLATGVRILGVAMIPVMLSALLFLCGGWGRNWRRLSVSLIPGVVLLGLYQWRESHVFRSADISLLPNAPEQRLSYIHEALLHLPFYSLATFFFVLSAAFFLLWPLFTSTSLNKGWRRAAVITLLAIAGSVWLDVRLDKLWPYCALCDGNTWTVSEMGQTQTLLRGYEALPPPATGRFLKWAPTFLTLLLISRLRWQRVGDMHATLIVAMLTLGVVGAILFLWKDRYLLPFAPPLIAVVIMCAGIERPKVAVASIAVMAGLCLTGTKDYMAINAALWRGVEGLRNMGATTRQIDGGYVVNGWLQYAHPQTSPRRPTGELVVPGVTTGDRLLYAISSRRLNDYTILEEIPFHRWMGRDGTLYLLKSLSAPTAD